jgi:hypothetical protein
MNKKKMAVQELAYKGIWKYYAFNRPLLKQPFQVTCISNRDFAAEQLRCWLLSLLVVSAIIRVLLV